MVAAVTFHSLQHPAELDAFIEIMKRENVKSYLEIGCNYGGTFRKVGMALDSPTKLVAVDIGGETDERRAAMRALYQAALDLNADGRPAKVVIGNSTKSATIGCVREHAPFDCIFIDGGHLKPIVLSDWENYGPMGHMIAFHDIAWRRTPDWKESQRIDVPQIWNVLKISYRHEEIRMCPTTKNCGIGILWR